jgi:hypothetical protein
VKFLRLLPVFLCPGLVSCAYKQPAAFAFYADRAPVLYGLSKNAAAGALPFSGEAKLEYVFETPLEIRGDLSFELDYTLNLSSNERDAPGALVLELGDLSWELPRNLGFLGIQDFPETLRYAVPVPEGKLERISIGFVPKDPGPAKAGQAPAGLQIRSMALAGRWYGFSGASGFPFSLSPFVFLRDSGLVIDPAEGFRKGGELRIRTQGGSLKAEAGKGKGSFRIESSGKGGSFLVPGGFISAGSFPLTVNAGSPLQEVRLAAPGDRPFPEPIPADPGMILAWPQEAWRDPRFEIFRWEGFDSILIFDMADYAVQDRFLKRLAFFVEKKGFRGRLAEDEEIASLHGWNAHDYRAASLADFFEAARKSNFPLLREERELEAILFQTGILRMEGETIISGEGAVISVSRQSDRNLRSRFMAHEGFHGLFFIDSDFREFCRRRWNSLSDAARRFIRSYFDFQAYDVTDTELLVNEFMAYVLQQPVSQAGKYFGEHLPGQMLAVSAWRRAALPETEERSAEGTSSWPEISAAFTIEGEAFSAYVNRRWGLAAGRVSTVSVFRD